MIAIFETCSRLPISEWHLIQSTQSGMLKKWSKDAGFASIESWRLSDIPPSKTPTSTSNIIGAIAGRFTVGRLNEENWKTRAVSVFLLRKLAGESLNTVTLAAINIMILFLDIWSSGLADANQSNNVAEFNGSSNTNLRLCFEFLSEALPREWAEWSRSDIQVPEKYSDCFKSSKTPFPKLFHSAELQIEKSLTKKKLGEYSFVI